MGVASRHDLETLSTNVKEMPGKRKIRHFVITALIAAAALAGVATYWHDKPGTGYEVTMGFAQLERAYHDQRSDFMAEVSGTVVRILAADPNRPRAQEFVIRLQNGLTLTVVHDKHDGGEVPAAIGDAVTVRGKYKWSETGGSLQNTQHDPSIERRHGFIEHDGKRYQ